MAARSDPAAEAWRLLLEIMQTHRPRFLAMAAELGLSLPQLQALRAIEPGAEVPMSSLAGKLFCDNSNVTGIVDRLEARGLIERHPAPHDRRVKLLALTPEGERVRAHALAQMTQPPPELAGLSLAHKRALRDALRAALAGQDDAEGGRASRPPLVRSR